MCMDGFCASKGCALLGKAVWQATATQELLQGLFCAKRALCRMALFACLAPVHSAD